MGSFLRQAVRDFSGLDELSHICWELFEGQLHSVFLTIVLNMVGVIGGKAVLNG
jgi:hypothetical protein